MKSCCKKRNCALFLVALLVIVLVAAALYVRSTKGVGASHVKAPHIDGVVFARASDLNSFALTGTDNKPFTNASLHGRWTMLFFGFTNCSFVCPTTMVALNKMYAQLAKDKLPATDMPKIVFISVDPHRDSVQRVRSYVTGFNPAFMGARADLPHLLQLSNQLHVVFSKIQSKDGNKNHYMITHSAEIYLMDPKGQVKAYFSFPHKAKQMEKDYLKVLQYYKA